MVDVFMALLSFCGFDTPSLPAQGEQRRSTYFNIGRDIPLLDQCDRSPATGDRIRLLFHRIE
jgi:hypothetical protein